MNYDITKYLTSINKKIRNNLHLFVVFQIRYPLLPHVSSHIPPVKRHTETDPFHTFSLNRLNLIIHVAKPPWLLNFQVTSSKPTR